MKPRSDLAVENADGELIVLDKVAGKVHQLNASASFVWNCLDNGVAVRDIAQMLSEECKVERQTALEDVEKIIAQLKDLALIIE